MSLLKAIWKQLHIKKSQKISGMHCLTSLLNMTEHYTQKRETYSWVNEKTDCTSSFLTLVLSFCLWDNHYFNFVCISSLRFTKIIYKYVSHFLVYLSFGCMYFVVFVKHVHLLYRCVHLCMWMCMQACASQYGGQRQLLVLSHWSLSIFIFETGSDYTRSSGIWLYWLSKVHQGPANYHPSPIPIPGAGVAGMYHSVWLFIWFLESEVRFSCIHFDPLYWLSHLPSPLSWF